VGSDSSGAKSTDCCHSQPVLITTKTNTETLLDSCKEVGLEVNVEESKFMGMCCHRNVEQRHNKSFENVAKLEYLETRGTFQQINSENG